MSPEVQILRATVKAAMVHFCAAKKIRTIAINRGTKPIDLGADLPVTRLLKSLEEEATWSNLATVRDTLLTVLAVGSIARLGALRNMTRVQLDAAKEVEEDSNLVCVEVDAHKTSKKYGAAGIYVTKKLQSFLER
ncbi:hypothetical protein V1264_016707 [Littorina saxatilis]|uniref:Uncharacterized protein n=1 Tax=Littorina saxatilis TaxID=31220 RepID=A0AAN9BHK3_9CAEN